MSGYNIVAIGHGKREIVNLEMYSTKEYAQALIDGFFKPIEQYSKGYEWVEEVVVEEAQEKRFIIRDAWEEEIFQYADTEEEAREIVRKCIKRDEDNMSPYTAGFYEIYDTVEDRMFGIND